MKDLTYKLFELPADQVRVIHLSREQLIRSLGWTDRFEFRAQHSFPVPAAYEPITATNERLRLAIRQLVSGYIGLIGAPGSGKSTLLAALAADNHSERIVQYYAYVPDSRTPLSLRGESETFLHDIVLSLERAGYSVGPGLGGGSRSQLSQRLHEQLARLHVDWESTGRKTLIIVDGVDHIEREQRPDRSLLCDLPAPEEIPDGILFIIGSQKEQLKDLPDSVHFQLASPERRLDIAPLDKEAVYAITRRVLSNVTFLSEIQESIFIVSTGHPLALALILQRLCEALDCEGARAILDEWDANPGGVDAQYHSYWRSIETNRELRHLLACVARLRRPVDLDWLQEWNSIETIRNLRSVRHYFRHEGKRWYFFHNSFRQFILRESIKDERLHGDALADRDFHRLIADHCHGSKFAFWNWEETYHRVQAGDIEAVLQYSTPEYFRSQLNALRPISAISDDISEALNCLRDSYDVDALVRLLLSAAEMDQRRYELESASTIELLFDLGEYDIALEYIRNGYQLLVDQEFALTMVARFARLERMREAEILFTLAEPLDLLRGDRNGRQSDLGQFESLLSSWAVAATFVRPIDVVLSMIRDLSVSGQVQVHSDSLFRSQDIKAILLSRVGVALLDQGKLDAIEKITVELNALGDIGLISLLEMRLRSAKFALDRQSTDRAHQFFNLANELLNDVKGNADSLLTIAELAYKVFEPNSVISRLLSRIPLPLFSIAQHFAAEGTFSSFERIFRWRRLGRLLGDDSPPFELADANVVFNAGSVRHFIGCLAAAADISACALQGRELTDFEIGQRVAAILRAELFHNDETDFHSTSSSQLWRAHASDLYRLLIRSVAAHGSRAIEKLRGEFLGEWMGQHGQMWTAAVKRAVVLELERASPNKTWSEAQLLGLQATMLEGYDVDGRIKECQSQCKAWIEIGDIDRARKNLLISIRNSFGIGYRKDYQFNNWADWLAIGNRLQPEDAEERILWFAGAAASLVDSTDGPAASRGGTAILALAFNLNPSLGRALFQWFLRHHVMRWSDGLAKLLEMSLASDEAAVLPALDVTTLVLLPVSPAAYPELARMLIESAGRVLGAHKATAAARVLIERINRDSLPSARPSWLEGVYHAVALARLPIAIPSTLSPEREHYTSAAMKRIGEAPSLMLSEMLQRVRSIDDVLKFAVTESTLVQDKSANHESGPVGRLRGVPSYN
ncbi:ATP-binding protein [uncultured Paludibaculum sp.]|uniref:ATP-binding protein n=1 Tax=uncultured Paludibaculum sp. TaxID=1765020 RepID=UPI002AAAA98B|nr:ATP-binding protein [uncultured Paludibaculum sp.]